MATNLSYSQMIETFNSIESIRKQEFNLLKNISSICNNPEKQDEGRELVLRVLENRNTFINTKQIVNSLVSAVGLYPYLDQSIIDYKDALLYEYNRPLSFSKSNIVFHKEQNEIYRRLLKGDSVILSAPTSFGKSKIIDAIIASEKYNNIAIIVPTLALIDETRKRVYNIAEKYKVITHTSQKASTYNIFVFTAERAVAYEEFPKIDFFVVDEFYKIDAIEEDNSRTVALNIAFRKLLSFGGQFYMLGPSIEKIPKGIEEKYRCFFYPTKFSTVVSETHFVKKSGNDIFDLVKLCSELKDPTLIYCRSPARANEIAKAFCEFYPNKKSKILDGASSWASKNYHPEWIWAKAISKGIGIHHGRIPRSLAQFTIKMFNDLIIDFLICTTTLIEGVNTKAKNVIIFDDTIGKKAFDFFTFNNIRGRSGRMFEHFIGHVYLFSAPPSKELPFVDFPLVTQNERVPDSLLVQLDEIELNPNTISRTRLWTEQTILPITILRQNATIDPESQIELAEEIINDIDTVYELLNWIGIPKYRQLKYSCEIIWKYFYKENRSFAVYSANQLTFKINQLQRDPSIPTRVLQELNQGKYSAKDPDDAVEKVLFFDRNWAGFELPKSLMALSRIQEFIFKSRGLSGGDYSFFASQIESLFQEPILISLEEYGLPMQLTKKIIQYIGTDNDLDIALKYLKRVDIEKLPINEFEKLLVSDVKHYLSK